jgi:PBP superfamily domain
MAQPVEAAMSRGICRSPVCPAAAKGTLVERYPGPGEYCPECGELLEPMGAPPQTPAAPQAPVQQQQQQQQPPPPPQSSALPFGGLSALEALQQFDAAAPPAAPEPAKRPRKRFGIASAGVVLAAIAVVFLFRPTAMGRATPSDVIHICRSAMTERFAGDVVRAYAANRRLPASRFELSSRDACDVRFTATTDASGSVVGYDGIVVIVNPQNPLTHLTNTDARRIFRGEVTDWDELGEAPGPIVAILPEEGTDEAQVLAQKFALGTSVGANIRRLSTGAEIVRAVTSASGRRAIGMVAFSASVVAKVVKLDGAPAPSVLSIGDQRYPLAVAITVQGDGSAHRPVADGLVRYARSDAAQSLVSQDGFVPKKGF